MWDLSQNDECFDAYYYIFYSIQKKKKHICIRIGRAGLYIYFGIKATMKLLEKKRVLHFILVLEVQLNC